MRGNISKAHRIFDDSVDTKIPRHGQGILGMHEHIQGRFGWSVDTRRSSNLLHLKDIMKS
jgi:hypothetical protein